MTNGYSKSQLEDKALKSASMYFGKELLPYFKIKKKILRMLPTEQIRLEAVLYAFACKLLQETELNEIKEALSMTVLGEMIWNDGEQKGVERGSNTKLITQICLKPKKGKMPAQIADELEEQLSVVESICEIAEECAPEYDCEKIYQLLETQKSGQYIAD